MSDSDTNAVTETPSTLTGPLSVETRHTIEIRAAVLTRALMCLEDVARLLALETEVTNILGEVSDLAEVLGRLAGLAASGDMAPGRKGPSGAIPDLLAVDHCLLCEVKARAAVNYEDDLDQLQRMSSDHPDVPIVLLLLVPRTVPPEAKEIGARIVHGNDLADALADTYPAVSMLLRYLWNSHSPEEISTVLTPADRPELLSTVLSQARRSQYAQLGIAEDLRTALGAGWQVATTNGRTPGSLGWYLVNPGLDVRLQVGARGSHHLPALWCHNRAAKTACFCVDWPETILGPNGAALLRQYVSPYSGDTVGHVEYLMQPPSSRTPLPTAPAGLREEVAIWVAGLVQAATFLRLPGLPQPVSTSSVGEPA